MDEHQKRSLFPKDFLWGASVSSHQVEGGNDNDWTRWELENASELARIAALSNGITATDDKIPPEVWERVKDRAAKPSNYVSGRGVDHYKLYKTDFALLKKLSLNSFRFGIEWSRIEPEEGRWDEEAIVHYQKYIDELNEQGTEPVLNIWHYTLPTWFADKGGFTKRSNLKYWRRFIQKVAEAFGQKLTYVITINEPNVYATFSYVLGLWPPGKKNYFQASRAIWNQAKAHRQAYIILKKENPRLQISVATQLANIQAKHPHNLFDELSTKIMRIVWNWFFLNRIRKQQDFVGFNYYFSDYYTGLMRRSNPKVPHSDTGWYMEPEGLYPLLLRAWSHYKKPIIVTECGVADAEDRYRKWWLEESIVAMERAISEGVDLRGFFYWSLLDNFEWEKGWWPKFGLVEVNRKTMRRELRPSSKWFAEKIKSL